MNFFVATIGRSGSSWLSAILNKSKTHEVHHEEVDPRDPMYIHPFKEFPIERFSKPRYGEVHGFLRYHLSGEYTGIERLIPRRVLMLRNTKDVIRSWMNRDNRSADELSAVIFEVSTQERLLRAWAVSDPEVRLFRFEDLTTELTVLEDLCQWLEVGYVPTQKDLDRVINPNNPVNHWFEWDDASNDLYDKILARQVKRTQYED